MTSIDPAPYSPILIFHPDASRAEQIAHALMQSGLPSRVCEDEDQALAHIYNEPPEMMVIHYNMGSRGGEQLAAQIKADNIFAHLPILFLTPAGKTPRFSYKEELPFDDYIEEEAEAADLQIRAHLCIQRAKSQLDANPLTRLPGNNSITRCIEGRLEKGEEFATCYIDIDHFKAFNDRYGFARGDQALKLTARLLVNCVNNCARGDYFIGHVGGDDFLFIVQADKAAESCELFIHNFDAIILSLYDDEDRNRREIHSVNRKGEKEVFPIMSVSLSVVINHDSRFSHPGEISTIAAELKKELKKLPASNYLIDRRRPSSSHPH
ncbi:MAG: diguanylate cyclase [Candidatus Sumerlaeia bacterium]